MFGAGSIWQTPSLLERYVVDETIWFTDRILLIAKQHSSSRSRNLFYVVVTCEIKLFWSNFEIISVFYFTRNHWRWLHVQQNMGNYFKIIPVFYFTSNHVWIILKLFQPLKLFQNYFSDIEDVGKYSWAAISIWNNFEIILGKKYFRRTSTKA